MPRWVLTNEHPAVYDSESATVLEQTAKIYGKMNELIEDYNGFTSSVIERIAQFESSTSNNIEEFQVGIRQEFQDFIDIVNLKVSEIENAVKNQNETIDNSIGYIKNNIGEWTVNTVNEMVRNGQLFIGTEYDDTTKSLNIIISEV